MDYPLFLTMVLNFFPIIFYTKADQLMELSVKIGENCKRDYHCVPNAYCANRTTCACEDFYFHMADDSGCLTASGHICTSNDNCSTMANAECTKGFCSCKENYLLDKRNSSNCIIKPSRNGDFCQETVDCVEAIGNAICINNKCNCMNGHIFINQTNKCILARGLHSSCKHDYECYDKNATDVLFCINSECSYIELTTIIDDNVPDKGYSIVSSLMIIGSSLLLCAYFS